MPHRPAHKKKKNERQQIRRDIKALGLPPGSFTDLIDRAIRKSWTPEQFTFGLRRRVRRLDLFPGLFEKGLTFNPDLGAETLGEAISRWQSFKETIEDGALKLGLSQYGNLTKGQVGQILRSQKSPDEFIFDLRIIQHVQENQAQYDAFNDQLRRAGRPSLSLTDQLNYAAGMGSADLYDFAEAAQLQVSGLVGAENALTLARSLQGGEDSPLADIADLVGFVRANLADIGPELARQGISNEDLILLRSGQDPRGIEPTVRQLVAQRRERGQRVAAPTVRRGAGGGVALLPEEQPAQAD